ncbi:hypothetical protein SAMN03159376_02848 [Pseudomonas sp. NFACC09-4]|uniref:hypothetical protein n=1 Tax=unclassified Pseudomonas TaxID=196821 RepID=UPI000908D0E5|nr:MULTISPECIES: hypothetical protein [unclassified Pseudomonas]ROO38034.1 hypothetical protein BIV08_02650 [Pseudomonas sp. AF76]SFW67210.1 hypothetical protein SAMN03159376_02848 [Pseudomonas sp. NFACC09-4]
MRRAISITVLSALAGLAQAQDNDSFNCSDFLTYGTDVDATRKAFKQSPEAMAWNWFVCLNQSDARGYNRQWESFKPSDQVYLANGANPGSYDSRMRLPDEVIRQANALGLNSNRVLHNLNATQQVDGLSLEMDGAAVPDTQKGHVVRFQLLMGQDTYNYIVKNNVYNMNGQDALSSSLNFPATAWELKAAWLWIGADMAYKKRLESDGYYVAQAYYPVGTGYRVGYAALSGLHVVNKLTSSWVWTTFENVNNSKYTVTKGQPSAPMKNQTGPTSAAIPVNTQFQASQPGLSKYELIGVEYQRITQVLANSQLESAFQDTSSCLACHDTAAYSKNSGYFNFAIPTQGGLTYPTTPLSEKDFTGYNKLDFVWSLKRAQWQR